jgi:hypothetical protein
MISSQIGPARKTIEYLFIDRYIPGIEFTTKEAKLYFPEFFDLFKQHTKIIMARTNSTWIALPHLYSDNLECFSLNGDYSTPHEPNIRFSFEIQTWNRTYARKKYQTIHIVINTNTGETFVSNP